MCFFAKNLKKHLKSNGVEIRQILDFPIAFGFRRGFAYAWKSIRNSWNELDFRGFMAFPSGFVVSVPHGAVSFCAVSLFSFCAESPMDPHPIKFADFFLTGGAGLRLGTP